MLFINVIKKSPNLLARSVADLMLRQADLLFQMKKCLRYLEEPLLIAAAPFSLVRVKLPLGHLRK